MAAAKAVDGKKIRRAERLVPVQLRPPAPSSGIERAELPVGERRREPDGLGRELAKCGVNTTHGGQGRTER